MPISKSVGPLSESQSVAWFRKLAEALDEGHRKGLIHRDIKARKYLDQQGRRALLGRFWDRPADQRDGQDWYGVGCRHVRVHVVGTASQ